MNKKTTTTAPTVNLTEIRSEMRTIIRTIDDYQGLRIATGNRLKRKADGTDQKDAATNQPNVTVESILDSVDLFDDTKAIEDKLTKQLEKLVTPTKEWKLYFKDVKGIGPKLAGIIISEIDPYKAATVSKIWQYAGMNPGEVFGKKKDKDGNIITTTERVRGDRKTAGFLCPYNSYLKMACCGKIATQLIMCKNEKYYGIYENAKNFYNTNPAWKDKNGKHKDMAARRKMMKVFLQDYYAFVRPLYGLEARPPYAEEKMGIKHHYYNKEGEAAN